MVIDEIQELLTAPQPKEADAYLERLESTLTAGYAHALQLEGERWRIERRIGELAARLADAEVDHLAHAVRARLRGQARRAHEVRFDLRERSLVLRREAMEEEVADDEAEHGVAEELERLVVADVLLLRLVRVRLVRQRAREKVAPREAVADALLEARQVVLQDVYCVARDTQPSPVTLSTELA